MWGRLISTYLDYICLYLKKNIHILIRLTYLIFWCALPTFWSSTAADVNKTIPRNTSEKIPRTDLSVSLAWLDLFRLVLACLNSSLVVLVILQLVFRYIFPALFWILENPRFHVNLEQAVFNSKNLKQNTTFIIIFVEFVLY